MSTHVLSNATDTAVREVAPWLEKLARLGFVAKAILYITVGALATAAALRLGGGTTGSRGAMARLISAPFGETLLVIIAVGLFGYAAWRIVEGIADPERNGTSAKGVAKRVRSVAVGVLHAALALSAIKLAAGDLSAAQDGGQSQHWVARALAAPGGTVVLWLVAGGLVAYGAYQLFDAWRARLDRHLRLGSLSGAARRWVIGASRFGIAARGVVFVTIGVLVARAIQQRDPREAQGVKRALGELFALGRVPFLIVAAGLVAYGIYQLINARYRRIDVA